MDTNCSTDKFELCLRNGVLANANVTEPCDDCPYGLKLAGPSQRDFAEFLACFEGHHHAEMAYVARCAKAAPAVEAVLEGAYECAAQAESRELLWAAENARPFRKNITHFPTVLINGAVWQNGDVPNTTLASAICAAYRGASPVCGHQQAPTH